MLRNVYIATRVNDLENSAIEIWADSEGLDKSALIRHLVRLALREKAPRSIFPKNIVTALHLSQDAKS